MTRVVTALLAAAVLAGFAGAAPAPPDTVLGIEWRAGGGRLAWRAASTLEPRGPVVGVGGASVGLAATSPDGTLAALSRADGRLQILRLHPLRSLWTLQTGGRHLAAAFWAGPGRLVAVAGGDAPAVVVVDAQARRVVARHELEGALYGAAAGGRRLVALLAPSERSLGPARLSVVAGDGSVRTVALPGVDAGFAPAPDGTGRMASPGLAISPDGGRAAVVGLDAFVTVELDTLAVKRAPRRTLARSAKRVEGWSRRVIWLGRDRVAVIARTHGYEGDRPVWTTSGVRLHRLGSALVRSLDETATEAARAGGTLLAFGGSALRAYDLEGRLRFELLRGRDTGYVQTAGRYAYVGSHNSTRFVVVDLHAGRVVGSARTAKPTIVLDP